MLFFLSVVVLLGFILLWVNYYRLTHPKWQSPTQPFPGEWKVLLIEEIPYYSSLSAEQKEKFEYKVHEFLLNCRITGVKTEVTESDKIHVAASAIIPVFGFKDWRYSNIHEVLLYPNMFNEKFELEGENRRILGMVGNRNMEGIMILSKRALELGFENETDKQNTAIHEFAHLLDKSDGQVDGIPRSFLDHQYIYPWVKLMNEEMEKILDGKSDIRPYGATNPAEFFSVASEYFFEQPQLLAEKHPELYVFLERIFNQNMQHKKLRRKSLSIGRNEPCICDSGEKFKKCCGINHY